MAYSLDLAEGLKYAVLLGNEEVEDFLDADGVAGNGFFDFIFVLAGDAVGEGTHLFADTLDKTFCEKVEFVVALHIKNLILKGRAAAVQYKYDHC